LLILLECDHQRNVKMIGQTGEKRMSKSRLRKIPEEIYFRIDKLGNSLELPNTKAFVIQEKFLHGEFKKKYVKKKNGKKIIGVEFEI